MGKVVISTCCKFCLSGKAIDMLSKIKKHKIDPLGNNIKRHDPDLIHVVKYLGDEAGDDFSTLVVYEFDGKIYRIEENDGCEFVITPNCEWNIVDS